MYLECVKYRNWSELPPSGYIIVGQVRTSPLVDKSLVGHIFYIKEVENGTDQYIELKPSYNSRADAKNDLHLSVKYNRDRGYVNMFFWVVNVDRLRWATDYERFVPIEEWHSHMYKLES